MHNYYEILKIAPTVELEEIIRSLELERNIYSQQTNVSKQEIAVAIEQLEEIEKTLLDPIKRAEYNRKLQKEQRNRKYQEQIAKEQEELQSFAANDLSKVQSHMTEISILEGDCATASQTNLDKQPTDREIKIESGDRNNITVKEEVSPHSEDGQKQETIIITEQHQASTTSSSSAELTASKPSGLNKWQQSMITGVFMGSFVLLGLVLLKPNPPQPIVQLPAETATEKRLPSPTIQQEPTKTPTEKPSYPSTTENTQQDFTQEDAANLIEKWQNAKREVFAPPFNRQLGTEILTGKAYYDNIGKPDGSVGWLENNDSHYTYGVQSVNSVENFEKNGNYATIDAVITEERTLHNGNGSIDRKASGFDTRLVRYSLKSDNGQWKIADYHTVRRIKNR
jgi:ARC6-like, IMS domain